MNEKLNYRKDRTGLYFSIFAVLLLILFLILSIYLVKLKTDVTPSAKGPSIGSIISLENSYIFASPVRASVGGELIRITVFVLDQEGNGIFDRQVELGNQDSGLDIKGLQSLTDETGKAIFDVASSVGGVYFLETSVDGELLPQRVKITFD
ncbi:Ig-like domain-containing protein [Candidatus Microgenomates bacterium]|nr:Ig-like domain-containing protein [Candidatus Microgenomates bacterium]